MRLGHGSDAVAKPADAGESVAVVIVAAGRGERAGTADGPKQYRTIGGRPVIARTLEAFWRIRAIGQVVVAIHADDRRAFPRMRPARLPTRVIAVDGGATRQESTRLGLRALRDDAPEHGADP